MSSVAMSGNDTLKINERILADLGAGDVAVLNFPNELGTVKTGKNGNSIFSFNATGKQSELVIKVIRGTADDKYLNGLVTSYESAPEAFVLATGEFIKRVGDGKGNISLDTYIANSGIPSKKVEAKSNTEGDVEQSLSTYTFRFANTARAIE